jgi:LuxR family maltose regulon positive regulatory protein
MNTRSLPLIRTKLHRPPVTAEIVCRKRLHKVMDRALELPLTLVSAPAGYGKSTLVSHWAESLDELCAWLSLDPGNSDLEVFVSNLLAAIESVVPDACPETRANLAQQTEGWILALRLVSLHLRHADDPEALLKRLHGGVQYTREYTSKQRCPIGSRREPATTY